MFVVICPSSIFALFRQLEIRTAGCSSQNSNIEAVDQLLVLEAKPAHVHWLAAESLTTR
jgi:hypothetical protein